MRKSILEIAEKPLRSREDAVSLILYTIRTFDVVDMLKINTEEKVIISVNKMNRIFYVLKKKIFSMQFPFYIEYENQKIRRIYDLKTGVTIDSVLISVLISILENAKKNGGWSFENFFDVITNNQDTLNNISIEQLWEIVKHIISYDLGYLRYDFDEEHENGQLHPLHHLDIFFDSNATYKIGLNKSVDYPMFKNMLDITTECCFLKM